MEDFNPEIPLDDMLQLIDEWKVTPLALFELDAENKPPAKATKTRKPRGKRERERLQYEIVELQSRLESLATLNDWKSEKGPQSLLSEWREIAARQREQRIEAEIENIKLRRFYEEQLKVSQKTTRLVRKVEKIGRFLGSFPITSHDSYRGPHVDVQEQLLRLDCLASQATTYFSSNLFATQGGNRTRHLGFHDLGPEGFMVELVMSWVLPFPVEDVANALWAQTTRMHKDDRDTTFQDIFTDARTLVSLFTSDPKAPGTFDTNGFQYLGGSSHGQLATRRELPISSGSVLLVSTVDLNYLQRDPKCGSRLKGNGMMLAEPLGPSASPVCRVKWIRQIVGSPVDASAASVSEFSRWVKDHTNDAMRHAWWHSVESNIQAVENMLLDPTWRASTTNK